MNIKALQAFEGMKYSTLISLSNTEVDQSPDEIEHTRLNVKPSQIVCLIHIQAASGLQDVRTHFFMNISALQALEGKEYSYLLVYQILVRTISEFEGVSLRNLVRIRLHMQWMESAGLVKI
jgi:hypothetical protein